MADNFRSGYLEQGTPLGSSVKTVTLTADDQFVDVQLYGMIRLGSDNTTAANRTFTLGSRALQGQMLMMHFVTAGSTTAQLADSGNVALSAAWEPLVNDTLTLQWDGASSVWRELCRADN